MIATTLHFAANILAWRHSTMSALLHITGTVPDQSKGLMSKTMAMYVRFKPAFISLHFFRRFTAVAFYCHFERYKACTKGN